MPDVRTNPSLARAGSTLPADLVHRVTAAIDSSRDELIALVQDLVRIPSENPSSQA